MLYFRVARQLHIPWNLLSGLSGILCWFVVWWGERNIKSLDAGHYRRIPKTCLESDEKWLGKFFLAIVACHSWFVHGFAWVLFTAPTSV